MGKVCYASIFLAVLPIAILAILQDGIMEVSLPDGGGKIGVDRLPLYTYTLDLNGRQHIRFFVKACHDAFLLFADKYANTIDINTDHGHIEVQFAGMGNAQSVIRTSPMLQHNAFDIWTGGVSTPNLLDGSIFNSFWISWQDGVMKVGYGLEINRNTMMQRNYPMFDVKYLSLWNGWGCGGMWKLFVGMRYSIQINSKLSGLYGHVLVSNINCP